MATVPHQAHLGFIVDLVRPASAADEDLTSGRYLDIDQQPLGDVIFERQQPRRRFLLIVPDSVVAMHVEAALENDHRTESRARRAVLRYSKGSEVPAGVVRDGDPWETGGYVAYAFGSEDQALAAERAT